MKFRITSKLLHLKQTLLFIIFGLIIGYFSFISATFFASINLLRESQRGIEEIFFNTEEESDWLYNAFILNPETGERYLQRLTRFIPDEEESIQFNLFMRENSPPGDWVFLASSQEILAGMIMNDCDLAEALQKAIKKGVDLDTKPYFGQKGTKSILIDITSPFDKNTYVIQLIHSHTGLMSFISQKKDVIITFGVFVLVMSTLLGSLFAAKLVKPIRQMADKAITVAEGHMDVDLRCNRLDDIGLLSRSMNTMVENIRHRMATMKTMNRIDRAVLSSLSRRELLYQVTGFISDQFDRAGVSLLEKVPPGYQIIATAPRTPELENKLIYNRDLPEKMLQNAHVPLEITHLKLPDKIKVFPEGTILSRILSIPLYQEEQFMGVFIISLDKATPQDREALMMLTDQVGVALKSLHDMDKREELYKALFLSLTRSVDAKSRWTAGHSDRVAELAESLSRAEQLNAEMRERIRMGALLHDIGKIAIPESILDKPGKLSDQEFDMIKQHPSRGYEILKDVPDFQTVRDIVLYHHERWDGSGYPGGTVGRTDTPGRPDHYHCGCF